MSPQKILMMAASALLVAVAGLVALGSPSIASAQGPTGTPAPKVDATGKVNKLKQHLRALQSLLRATDLHAGLVMTNTHGTLTVRTIKGPAPVQTNASTIVVVAGKTDGKVSDIEKGNLVIVKFPGDDITKPASFVMSFAKGFKLNELRLGAVLDTKNGDVRLRTRQGNGVVTTKDATLVDLSGDQAKVGTVDDLKQGNAVLVIGKEEGKTFDAQTIIVLDQDARALLNKAKKK